MLWAVDLVKPAGRAAEQDDPWLSLERLAELPADIWIAHVREEHVEVLDDKQEARVMMIGEVEQRAEASFSQCVIVIRDSPEIVVGQPEARLLIGRSLVRQAAETFQP